MQQKALKRTIKDELLEQGVINDKILWLISKELNSLGWLMWLINAEGLDADLADGLDADGTDEADER